MVSKGFGSAVKESGRKETFRGQGINLAEGSTIKGRDLDSRSSLYHQIYSGKGC